MSAVNRIRTSMTSVIVSVLAIATLATAFRDNLFVDIPWQTWLPMLAVLAASGAAGAVGVGVAIIMKRPWALGFAWGCLASMTLLFLVYAGASRFFALVVLGLGAYGWAALLLGRRIDVPNAVLAGLIVLAAVVGWTLPLPVHRIWVYVPLLLLPLPWIWRDAAAAYKETPRA